MNRNECKYRLNALDDVFTKEVHPAIMCGYYCQVKRKDGLYWAHFPDCMDKHCPILHPELLEGERPVESSIS